MNETTRQVCPKCGQPLPPRAPAGLCPRCLMALNLATQTAMTEAGAAAPAAPKPPPPSPEEIAKHFPSFDILECLGRGGMGVVYRARQKSLNRLVALKILAPERGADAAFAQRFAVEAKTLARLNHPGIVTIYDFGQTDGLFYLVMEFVDGVTLRQLLETGRVSPREALAIVPQICDALQYAHDQGIVHRDIKPENILLDRQGRVKVADFGPAKLVGAVGRADSSPPAETAAGAGSAPGVTQPADALTDAGKVMGTPQYMSPEQIEAPGGVDHRADIYALGVVFYQMLTGELPGKRLEPPSHKVQIDVRLDEVVLRALEKKPELRFQQVSEVKTMLETIASSATTGVAPAPSPSTPAVVQGRPRMSKGIVAAVFLLVTLAATVITFLLPESYKSTARVRVERVVAEGAMPGAAVPYDPYFIQTEFEVIQSQVVLNRVIRDLDLNQAWGMEYGAGERLPDVVTLQILRARVDLRPVRNTSLIEISVFSGRPKEAARIANAIAEAYQAYCVERRYNVQIVDRALPPLRPDRPNKPLNIFLGMVAGAALGLLAGVVSLAWSFWRPRPPKPGQRAPKEVPPEPATGRQAWGTWSPFQSPEVREICAHLTKDERNHASLLGLLFGVWIAATMFGIPVLLRSYPPPGNWIVAVIWVVLFGISIPAFQRMIRHFLASTAWARQQGVAPASLRLFSFRGRNLWIGLGLMVPLLSLVLLQNHVVARYIGLGNLVPSSDRDGRWHPQRMKRFDHPEAYRAVVRITDVVQKGPVAVFSIFYEPGTRPLDIGVTFQGPALQHLPAFDAATNLTGLVSATVSGYNAWPGTLICGTNRGHGPGSYQFGFVFPDEATAVLAVKQARALYLGSPCRIGDNQILCLFQLNRLAGRDDQGNDLWETLQGMLHLGDVPDLTIRPTP